MITGWKKLTAEERRLLREDAGVHTNEDFQRTLDSHQQLMVVRNRLYPSWCPPVCWDCYLIAQKLGLDTTGLK